MFKKLLISVAVSSAVITTPSIAQVQSPGFGAANQVWAQERVQALGTRLYISPAGVRQVQQALNQAGFDVGNIDGQWNAQTVQAVRSYQRSQGLAPTGTLTLSLLSSLGALNVLTGAVYNQQGGQQWTQEMAIGRGTPVYVSPAGIRMIEQALNQRGYSVGPVDGIWDPGTIQAVRAFQRAMGLEPTGRLDVRLINALGGSLQALANSFGSRQADMQWSQEQVMGPGTALWVSPATVRQVQQALNQRGYSTGGIYGQWSRLTVRAVRHYQKAQGMEPTGTLTPQLLMSLGLNDWTSGYGGGFGNQQVGYGSGYGNQAGYGAGYGNQAGYGAGYGNQAGYGAGYGNQVGYGAGYGNQAGYGGGFGNQAGYGGGFGNQAGYGAGYGNQAGYGAGYGNQAGYGTGYGNQAGYGAGYGNQAGYGAGFGNQQWANETVNAR